MLFLTLCLLSFSSEVYGLSKKFDESKLESLSGEVYGLSRKVDEQKSTDTETDETQFDDTLQVDVEGTLGQSVRILEAARKVRRSQSKFEYVERSPSWTTRGLRTMRQANDWLSLFRDAKTTPTKSKVLSEEAKQLLSLVKASTSTVVGSKTKALSKKQKARQEKLVQRIKQQADEHWSVWVGMSLDIVDLALLVASAFKPEISKFVEFGTFFLWWGVGMMVFMLEGEFSPVDSMYALMQIPTTIGFGDVLPKQSQYALKLFETLHIMVSSVYMSGAINSIIDWALDKVDSLLKLDTNAKKLMTSGFLLVCEMVFGAFFYATEQKNDNYMLDLIDSFYMTVIALTTVGYGDISPQTQLGRILGFFWGHTGTEILARFMDTWNEKRHEVEERVVEFKNAQTNKTETITTDAPLGDVASDVTEEEPEP